MEDAGFGHFMKGMDPRYHIPGRKALMMDEIPQLLFLSIIFLLEFEDNLFSYLYLQFCFDMIYKHSFNYIHKFYLYKP